MNCRYAENRMAAYLDAELTGEEMMAIRNHLNHCNRCSAEFEGYKRVKQLVSALPSKNPCDDFESRLLSAVKNNSAISITRANNFSRNVFAFGIAAVLLIAAFTFTIINRGSENTNLAIGSPIESDQAFVQASTPYSTGFAVSFDSGPRR